MPDIRLVVISPDGKTLEEQAFNSLQEAYKWVSGRKIHSAVILCNPQHSHRMNVKGYSSSWNTECGN